MFMSKITIYKTSQEMVLMFMSQTTIYKKNLEMVCNEYVYNRYCLASVSKILLIVFSIVLTVWYYIFFILHVSIQRLNNVDGAVDFYCC